MGWHFGLLLYFCLSIVRSWRQRGTYDFAIIQCSCFVYKFLSTASDHIEWTMEEHRKETILKYLNEGRIKDAKRALLEIPWEFDCDFISVEKFQNIKVSH